MTLFLEAMVVTGRLSETMELIGFMEVSSFSFSMDVDANFFYKSFKVAEMRK